MRMAFLNCAQRYRFSIVAIVFVMILVGGCEKDQNLYIFKATVIDLTALTENKVTLSVQLNGDAPLLLTCRIKPSLSQVWQQVATGQRITISRTTRWKYLAKTFCGVLNSSTYSEILGLNTNTF